MGRLVWLASYPKSGNTWLRLLLHNFVLQPESPFDINRLDAFSTSEDMARHFRRLDPRPATEYTAAEVQRMRPLVHRALRDGRDGVVFVKTHNAAVAVGGVPLVTPDATWGAVVVVRDPRDVAVSYSHHFAVGVDEAIGIMERDDATTGGTDTRVLGWPGSWSLHVASWTAQASPRVHVMRYEDLVADTVAAAGGMIRFFGLEVPEARLARAVAASRFEVAQAQERRSGFVEHPPGRGAFFRQGRAGGWREVLSAAQAGRVEAAHGVQMARLGYL